MLASIELLTKNEAAAALRLSLRTVDALIAKGEINVVRPGGRRSVRIEPAELRRFIDASRQQTPAA
jgi:excisionase family DNA binding protein